MKKLLLGIVLMSGLLCAGCMQWQDVQEDPQNEAPTVTAALQGTGEEIIAAYYAEDFDWEYDELPVLTLDRRSDVLEIAVGDTFGEAVTLGENHYTYIGDSGEILCEDHELMPDEDGVVSLGVGYRGSDRDEYAFYFLRDEQGGRYVFKVVHPFAMESVSTEEEVIQLFVQRAGLPMDSVLDCALVDDGAYDLAGVVIYQDDDLASFDLAPFNVAFVGLDGYYNTVGLHAELTEDIALTYLGDSLVEFSATGEGDAEPYRYTVEFDHVEDGVSFRVESEPMEK